MSETRRPGRRGASLWGAIILILLILLGWQLLARPSSPTTGSDPLTAQATVTSASVTETATPAATTTRAGPTGMPVVALDDLPPEALETLELIDAGGPFPYDKDGSTFQNREGLLPDEPEGYYQEYTVETPGSPDRGARRIVAGAEDERYYTDDHYASFSWILTE